VVEFGILKSQTSEKGKFKPPIERIFTNRERLRRRISFSALDQCLFEIGLRRFYCKAGVSPAIERLTHAGETPALHSEVQKQAVFGLIRVDSFYSWFNVPHSDIRAGRVHLFSQRVRMCAPWVFDGR
jgi:hypothetical protein